MRNALAKLLTLRLKFFIFTLIYLLLPLLLLGLFMVNRTIGSLESIEKESIVSSAVTVDGLIKKQGNQMRDLTMTYSKWDAFYRALNDRDQSFLDDNVNAALDSLSMIQFTATYDLKGKLITQRGDISPFTADIADPQLLERMLKEDDFGGLVVTEHGPAVVGISKVADTTDPKLTSGILVFGSLLDSSFVEETEMVLHAAPSLLDLKGHFIEKDPIVDQAVLQQFLPVIQTTEQSHFEKKTIGSDTYNTIVAPFFDIVNRPAGVMYVQVKADASSGVSDQIKNMGMAVLIVLIVLIVLYLLQMQISFIRPVRRLASDMRFVEQGDLTRRAAPRLFKRQDELGRLARSFNTMCGNLSHLVEQINENISSAAQTISGTTEVMVRQYQQTNQDNHKVKSSVIDVNAGSSAQKRGMEECFVSIRQMADDIQRMAAASAEVLNVSRQASTFAQEGEQSLQQMHEKIGFIHESVTETKTVIQTLDEYSGSISSMVQDMNAISSKTNILALNASIEASRAGELGRGFAVIAQEVRKLAEQSSQFSEKVIHLIEIMVQEIGKSDKLMAQVGSQVHESLEDVVQAKDNFRRISESTGNVKQRMEDVTLVSEQISAFSEQFYAIMEEMHTIAGRNFTQSNECVEVAAGMDGTLHSLGEHVHELSRLANKLQESLGSIKV